MRSLDTLKRERSQLRKKLASIETEIEMVSDGEEPSTSYEDVIISLNDGFDRYTVQNLLRETILNRVGVLAIIKESGNQVQFTLSYRRNQKSVVRLWLEDHRGKYFDRYRFWYDDGPGEQWISPPQI